MNSKELAKDKIGLEVWGHLLRSFKERLAKRLWSLPSISEKEKELIYKQHLEDLTEFEKSLSSTYEEVETQQKISKDENELIRSLLGLEEDEVRSQILTSGMENKQLKNQLLELRQQLEEINRERINLGAENEELRKHSRALEALASQVKADFIRSKEKDIDAFAESHEALKNEMVNLETRLKNLRELFAESNQAVAIQKQEEISLLQKNLLEEMEKTLKHRQRLVWAEEEMFAKGIAQKVRASMVSAQGQLLLTLERLGLMDPQSGTESFWKSRIKLLVEGASELSSNFKAIHARLQEVTATLDDYLHLTHRKKLNYELVSIKELVQKEMAVLYIDRRPDLKFELLSDDPLPDVSGDRELLQFSLNTLIQNAIDALPNESGQITVSVKNLVNEKSLRISIQDTGKGIPDHLMNRLFQPFFTTKKNAQGLNLSRARRYVEIHGGQLILIRSNSDGTTFEMVLPIRGI